MRKSWSCPGLRGCSHTALGHSGLNQKGFLCQTQSINSLVTGNAGSQLHPLPHRTRVLSFLITGWAVCQLKRRERHSLLLFLILPWRWQPSQRGGCGHCLRGRLLKGAMNQWQWGGQLACSFAGLGQVPVTAKILRLCSKGMMPLWLHSMQKEIKHGVFSFYQPVSIINFAAVLPVGVYIIRIWLHDDLAQNRGKPRLNPGTSRLATLKIDSFHHRQCTVWHCKRSFGGTYVYSGVITTITTFTTTGCVCLKGYESARCSTQVALCHCSVIKALNNVNDFIHHLGNVFVLAQ